MTAGSKTMTLPLLLLLATTACKTWEPSSADVRTVLADERPSSVRVISRDGRQMTLKNPLLVNDSLVSGTAPSPGMVVVPPRPGVLAHEVSTLEVARFSAKRSVALAAGILAASVGWARIQAAGSGSEERPGPLPKDPALDVVGLFRILVRAF